MPSKSSQRALQTHRCSLSDGRTLAYTCSGAAGGAPVVFHHGTPGSRLFAALVSEVAASNGVQLIVPDRPGYGHSSPPPREWTLENWRNDLTELLAAEAIDQAAILGFSGGGPFALAAATSDWASQLALVSTVVPPADNVLTTLAKVPFALRVLFGLSDVLTSITGPEAIVKQYTDQSVPDTIAAAVADDFHEALRQGATAAVRETRLFANRSVDAELDIPLRVWHGTRDENTPLPPVRAFLDDSQGTLITPDTDHLETLLDHQQDMFAWLSSG